MKAGGGGGGGGGMYWQRSDGLGRTQESYSAKIPSKM